MIAKYEDGSPNGSEFSQIDNVLACSKGWLTNSRRNDDASNAKGEQWNVSKFDSIG